jgi:hypothetical protein
MIQTITHKGLRLFFEKGNGSKLPSEYQTKIALIRQPPSILFRRDYGFLLKDDKLYPVIPTNGYPRFS